MHHEVEHLEAGCSIFDAADRFLHSNYRRFPVLRAGELVGQISRHDIMRALDEKQRADKETEKALELLAWVKKINVALQSTPVNNHQTVRYWRDYSSNVDKMIKEVLSKY